MATYDGEFRYEEFGGTYDNLSLKRAATIIAPTSYQGPTSDNWIELTGPTQRVNMQIKGQPIVYELAANVPGGAWIPGSRLNTGFFSLDRECQGIRFRSLSPGFPADVVVECLSPAEIA